MTESVNLLFFVVLSQVCIYRSDTVRPHFFGNFGLSVYGHCPLLNKFNASTLKGCLLCGTINTSLLELRWGKHCPHDIATEMPFGF